MNEDYPKPVFDFDNLTGWDKIELCRQCCCSMDELEKMLENRRKKDLEVDC